MQIIKIPCQRCGKKFEVEWSDGSIIRKRYCTACKAKTHWKKNGGGNGSAE